MKKENMKIYYFKEEFQTSYIENEIKEYLSRNKKPTKKFLNKIIEVLKIHEKEKQITYDKINVVKGYINAHF